MIKTNMLFLCAVLSVMIYSCGSNGTSSSSDSGSDLTTDEINSINHLLMNAVNSAGTTSSQQGAPNLLQSTPMEAISFANTCNGSNYQFTAAVNDTKACPTAGHITYTGNLKTYCSSWQYHTSPAVFCSCTGDWNTANQLTFQFGDRTNNLFDCETSGIILDGTVYVNATGKDTAIDLSINGSLSVNRRGPSGGLVPLNSCFINLLYKSSTGAWSGTICGRSVS